MIRLCQLPKNDLSCSAKTLATIFFQGFSSDLLMYFHKIGGIRKDWLKKNCQNQSHRGWDILTDRPKNYWSYISHNAIQKHLLLDSSCLVDFTLVCQLVTLVSAKAVYFFSDFRQLLNNCWKSVKCPFIVVYYWVNVKLGVVKNIYFRDMLSKSCPNFSRNKKKNHTHLSKGVAKQQRTNFVYCF